MSKLIKKFQNNGKFTLPGYDPAEAERRLRQMERSYYTQQPSTIAETVRDVRERNDNQKRNIALKRAVKKGKQNYRKRTGDVSGTAMDKKHPQIAFNRNNPEDVEVTYNMIPTRQEVLEARDTRINPNIDSEHFRKQQQENYRTKELEEKSGEVLSGLMEAIPFPSKIVGGIAQSTKDPNTSFLESMMFGNKGIGELDETAGEGTNLLFDLVAPAAWSKGLKLFNNPLVRNATKYMTTVRFPQTWQDYMRLGPIEFRMQPSKLRLGVFPDDIRFASFNGESRSINDVRDFLHNYMGDRHSYPPDQVDSIITQNASQHGLPVEEYLQQLGTQFSDMTNPYYYRFRDYLQNGSLQPPLLFTRTADEVKAQGRYHPDQFIDPNTGDLKPNVRFDHVFTGSHGTFISEFSDPDEVVYNLSKLRRHPEIGRREYNSITRSNPSGKSGIVVHTHDGDVSVDSSVLANAIQRRLGKEAVRLPLPIGQEPQVYLNGLGYNNLFSKKIFEDQSFINAMESGTYGPRNFNYTKFSDGSIVVKDKSGRIVGVYPALDKKEVLNTINQSIDKLNSTYPGLNYNEVVLDPNPPLGYGQWTFGEGIKMDNQRHVLYKTGGNIKKLIKKK